MDSCPFIGDYFDYDASCVRRTRFGALHVSCSFIDWFHGYRCPWIHGLVFHSP